MGASGASQPGDRFDHDAHNDGPEQRLGESDEVLGLRVPVVVGFVGRLPGEAHTEENEAQGDDVGGRDQGPGK